MFMLVSPTAVAVLIAGRAAVPAKPAAAQPVKSIISTLKSATIGAAPPGLAPATRDPFAPIANAPQQQAEAKVPKPAGSAAPAVPTAPPLNVRFEGRMSSPSGEKLVYASTGDGSVMLSVGQALPNGYIVKAIGDNGVDFDYPPLGTTAHLDLPPEPRQEVR